MHARSAALRRVVAVVLGTMTLVTLATLALSVVPLPPEARALLSHGPFGDQGPSPALAPGTAASYTLRFRNTGVAPWRRDVAEMRVDLGIASAPVAFSQMREGWPTADRVATTTEELVLPGGIGTFTFSVRAPQAPVAYRLPLRL